MNIAFTIKCNNCGATMEYVRDKEQDDYAEEGIEIPISITACADEYYHCISCDCGNEIII